MKKDKRTAAERKAELEIKIAEAKAKRLQDYSWLEHLDMPYQEVIRQIHEFTRSLQLIWEEVIPGKVYSSFFRDEIVQINCAPTEACLSIALEEICVGKPVIDKLCWAITQQRKDLRLHKGDVIVAKLYARMKEPCC